MRKEIVNQIVCDKCGTRFQNVKYEITCDECGEIIDEKDAYDVTVFFKRNTDPAKNFYFCSWICVFKWIVGLHKSYMKKIEFVNMPYLGSKPRFSDEHAKFVEALRMLFK